MVATRRAETHSSAAQWLVTRDSRGQALFAVRSVVEAGPSRFGRYQVLLVEVGHGGSQVLEEQVGEVVAEAVSAHDPQDREVLPVSWERVGGDLPSAFPQRSGQRVYVPPCGVVGRGEREDGQFVSPGQQPELREGLDPASEVHRDVTGGLLHRCEPGPSQPGERVVLRDDLRARSGEVQGEGRLVAAQVVDVKDQLLGQRRRVAPQDPAHARVDQSVLVA